MNRRAYRFEFLDRKLVPVKLLVPGSDQQMAFLRNISATGLCVSVPKSCSREVISDLLLYHEGQFLCSKLPIDLNEIGESEKLRRSQSLSVEMAPFRFGPETFHARIVHCHETEADYVYGMAFEDNNPHQLETLEKEIQGAVKRSQQKNKRHSLSERLLFLAGLIGLFFLMTIAF